MKTKLILLLCSIQTFCFAQNKANNTKKEEPCHYPKEEMKGKTQKEQLAIMRSYLECRQKQKERTNQNQNKQNDIEKQTNINDSQEKERQRQEQDQQERERNSNTPPKPSTQRNDPGKTAQQRAREERQRVARERAAEERSKKLEQNGI